jgi:hypothetical protein
MFVAPNVPITPGEISQEIDRMSDRFFEYIKHSFPITKANARAIYVEGYKSVQYQTSVDQLAVGLDGAFWLRTGSFGRTTAEWTAYDRDGNVRGRVSLPSTTKVLMVSPTQVWTAEFDDDEVPSVVRYSIK